MGCYTSKEVLDRCKKCNRKEINGLVIINHVCEICIHMAVETANSNQHSSTNGPYFGKFRCNSCKICWSSHQCWSNKYQFCKRCRIPVYAYYVSELRSMDMSKSNNAKKEHQKELCEMCQQLGSSCSSYGKIPNRNKNRHK